MEEIIRPWTSGHSLDDLTLHRDWDYMASMISSLRIYLFDHGAVPTWNFLICGGRPELAIPASWSYGWPSLFAYLLPPNQAIIAVWILLSAVGFAATFLLLRRWTGSALGAFTGAWVYVLSGYFAVRFNLGQVGFAFFHLLPLTMLLFERALEKRLAGSRALVPLGALTLVSFLFFTAALPHGLLFFYPALILLAAFRIWGAARAHGFRTGASAAAVALSAHGLGLWLAAYRVWPPVRWQLGFPRAHVLPERYTLGQVFEHTVRLVPDYFGPWLTDPWHVYPSAGYNAYVGPVPWLLALVALATLVAVAVRGAAAPRGFATAVYALVLLTTGLLLTLGNAHPWGPGSHFARLPVLEGIRAFNRYQVLTVFALATLSAFAIGWLRRRPGRYWRPLSALLSLSACAPVLAQAGLLVWNIEAVPRAESLAAHRAAQRPDLPQLIWMRRTVGPSLAPEDRRFLIEGGYWIANCKEDVQIPNRQPERAAGMRADITAPPPARLVRLSGDGLVLSYARRAPAAKGETVRWELPQLPGFRYNATPLGGAAAGRVVFAMADLPGGELAVTARYAGPAEGAAASIAGLGAAFAFFAWLRRKPERAGSSSG